MNVNLISTNENKLLERKEVVAEVTFEGPTPKRAELKGAVCQKVAANPDFAVVRLVESAYGRKAVRVTLYAYSTKEKLADVEPVHIKVREGVMAKPEKKKKAGPAPKKKA